MSSFSTIKEVLKKVLWDSDEITEPDLDDLKEPIADKLLKIRSYTEKMHEATLAENINNKNIQHAQMPKDKNLNVKTKLKESQPNIYKSKTNKSIETNKPIKKNIDNKEFEIEK